MLFNFLYIYYKKLQKVLKAVLFNYQVTVLPHAMTCNFPIFSKVSRDRNQLREWLDSDLVVE